MCTGMLLGVGPTCRSSNPSNVEVVVDDAQLSLCFQTGVVDVVSPREVRKDGNTQIGEMVYLDSVWSTSVLPIK